jgi:hypothetical protein
MLSLLIPQETLPKVLKRLGKLAKTAGVTLEELPGTTTLIKGAKILTCSRVTIGDLPSTGGYDFVAKIEHLKEGNVISRAPSETLSLEHEWRTAEPHCEHCEVKRNRKETFLLRQHQIRLMQIGRNCLADFLLTNPARLVAQAELVRAVGGELDDEHWGSYGGYWAVSPVAYIACAVASTERHGFIKSGDPGRSTRIDADWLSGGGLGDRKAWLEEQPTEDQIECAHQILAWAANPGENASEYRWNLALAVKEHTVRKHEGLLASAPAAYFRELGRELARKQKTPIPRPEGYAVEQGEVFKGEVELIRHYLYASDNKWGSMKAICTFRTDAGHELVWFASGIAPKPDMIGMRFQIKGRCKKHEPAKGQFYQRAVLSRVTWKPAEIKEEAKAS